MVWTTLLNRVTNGLLLNKLNKYRIDELNTSHSNSFPTSNMCDLEGVFVSRFVFFLILQGAPHSIAKHVPNQANRLHGFQNWAREDSMKNHRTKLTTTNLHGRHGGPLTKTLKTQSVEYFIFEITDSSNFHDLSACTDPLSVDSPRSCRVDGRGNRP